MHGLSYHISGCRHSALREIL